MAMIDENRKFQIQKTMRFASEEAPRKTFADVDDLLMPANWTHQLNT